jgi:hypothetical protein
MGMLRFKPASLFAERHHSVASCAFNMEDLIPKDFCKFGEGNYDVFNVYFTNQVTEFCATLHEDS